MTKAQHDKTKQMWNKAKYEYWKKIYYKWQKHKITQITTEYKLKLNRHILNTNKKH